MAKRDPGRAVPVDTGALAGANQGLHSPSAGKNRKRQTFFRRTRFCCHARGGKGGSGERGSQLPRVPTLLTLHFGAFLPEIRPVVSSAPCDSVHPARKSYPDDLNLTQVSEVVPRCNPRVFAFRPRKILPRSGAPAGPLRMAPDQSPHIFSRSASPISCPALSPKARALPPAANWRMPELARDCRIAI